jgi:hypothetical protein
MGLVSPLAAHARTHAQVLAARAHAQGHAQNHAERLSSSDKAALKQAHFVDVLLQKSNIAVANSEKTIAKQDILIQREIKLEQYVPANAHQARLIQQQFTKYGIQINKDQTQLNNNNIRLQNIENNVTKAINTLSGMTPSSPTTAQQVSDFLALAMQRAAVQEGEVEEILNRPAATPFVPGSFGQF